MPNNSVSSIRMEQPKDRQVLNWIPWRNHETTWIGWAASPLNSINVTKIKDLSINLKVKSVGSLWKY